jgi:competence protein ComEC
LLGPVAAMAAGIVVSRFAGFHQTELLVAIAAFLLLGILALLRGARVLAGACCLLGFVAGGALTDLVHRPAAAPELDAEGRELVILGGCVVEPPAVSGPRERFVLELEPHAHAQVTLYVKEGQSLPELRYGQNIELDARVRKPRNYGNPGAFDYAHYLARHDIYWTASGAASSVRILPGHCGRAVEKFAMDVRAGALHRIERLYAGDSYTTGMMQALLLGQQYQLQRVWTEGYRNTGTFHTIVISGTHVAIVAAFLLFFLRLCLVPQGLAIALTAVVAWLYALVAGWGAPCVRSAAGLTLVCIAGFFFRERRPLNLLAAVAFGFLLFDPDQLFETSFQLTFLAVAFLGAFATPLIRATSGPLARGLSDLEDTGRDMRLPPRVAQFRIEMRLLAETLRLVARLPRRAAKAAVVIPARLLLFFFEIAAISAVIQTGLALPMIVYFHRVGLSGLSANVLVVPVMGVAVPVGFVAVVTGWVWIGRIGGWLLGISQGVVSWHAAHEPDWRIPTPPLWLAIAFCAALLACGVARGRWGRMAAGGTLAVLLALLLAAPFAPQNLQNQLEVTAIDVGQGDSLLVTFPDGRTMLVDGGGIPVFGHAARSQLDIGEDVVAPYLWGRGFHTVDVVALSHAHEDHIGGLPSLVSDFHPRELWTGATPQGGSWSALQREAERRGIRIVEMREPRRFAFGGAEIEVLAPFQDYTAGAAPANNDSLVLRVSFGRRSFLLTGDIERLIERGILERGQLQPVDVLKVPHHGSHTSSSDMFLDGLKPSFALISVGYENSYGHPHRDVLDRLAQRHTAVYRTDRDGLVTIRTDGRRLYVETSRDLLRMGLLSGPDFQFADANE